MAVGITTHPGLVDLRKARSRNSDGTYTYFPNNDYLYGPYASKAEAWAKLSEVVTGGSALVVGKTVGIKDSTGKITEYWFEKAASSINDLVKKGASADDMKVTVTTAKDEYVQFYKGAKNADIVVSYLSGIYTIGGGNIGDYIVDGKIYAECINEDGTHVDCSPNVGSSDSISPVTYKGRSLYPINLSEAEYDDSGNTTISHSETPNNVYIVLYKKTASGSESEKTLAKAIQDNADAILDKAPYPSSKTDGKQYVMKNGVWVEVDIKTDASGITYIKDASGNTTGTVGKALDSLARGKAAAVHSHTASEITDLDEQLTTATNAATTATTKAGEASGSASAAALSATSASESATAVANVIGMAGVPYFVANKKYVINDYFQYGNKMYKITSVNGYQAEEFAYDADLMKETTWYDEVNERIWTSEYEKVFVYLEKWVDGDDGEKTNVTVTDNITVTVRTAEGNTNLERKVLGGVYYYEGRVRTGLDYEIHIGSLEGYTSPSVICKTAALPQRVFTHIYAVDEYSAQALIIKTNYATVPDVKPSTVYVRVGTGEEVAHEIVNDRCDISIPYGASYSVRFQDISVDNDAAYLVPPTVQAQANTPTNVLSVYYLLEGFGMRILKYDGTSIPISQGTIANKADYVGLWVCDEKFNNKAGGSFVIPASGVSGVSKQWCSQSVDFGMAKFTSSGTATNDKDGESNTQYIEAFIAEKGYSSSAVSYVRSIKFTIAGTEHKCMLPAYGQIEFICKSANYTFISKVFQSVFGTSLPAVISGLWWTSSEYSATNAVLVGNGSFGNYYKIYNYSVLPLLAY